MAISLVVPPLPRHFTATLQVTGSYKSPKINGYHQLCWQSHTIYSGEYLPLLGINIYEKWWVDKINEFTSEFCENSLLNSTGTPSNGNLHLCSPDWSKGKLHINGYHWVNIFCHASYLLLSTPVGGEGLSSLSFCKGLGSFAIRDLIYTRPPAGTSIIRKEGHYLHSTSSWHISHLQGRTLSTLHLQLAL